jgi:hypothetical protein
MEGIGRHWKKRSSRSSSSNTPTFVCRSQCRSDEDAEPAGVMDCNVEHHAGQGVEARWNRRIARSSLLGDGPPIIRRRRACQPFE